MYEAKIVYRNIHVIKVFYIVLITLFITRSSMRENDKRISEMGPSNLSSALGKENDTKSLEHRDSLKVLKLAASNENEDQTDEKTHINTGNSFPNYHSKNDNYNEDSNNSNEFNIYDSDKNNGSNTLLTLFTTFSNSVDLTGVYENTLRIWGLLKPEVYPVLYCTTYSKLCT